MVIHGKSVTHTASVSLASSGRLWFGRLLDAWPPSPAHRAHWAQFGLQTVINRPCCSLVLAVLRWELSASAAVPRGVRIRQNSRPLWYPTVFITRLLKQLHA